MSNLWELRPSRDLEMAFAALRAASPGAGLLEQDSSRPSKPITSSPMLSQAWEEHQCCLHGYVSTDE